MTFPSTPDLWGPSPLSRSASPESDDTPKPPSPPDLPHITLSSDGTTVHLLHAATGDLVRSIPAADALEDPGTEIRVLGAAGLLVQGGMQMDEAIEQAWDEVRTRLEELRA